MLVRGLVATSILLALLGAGAPGVREIVVNSGPGNPSNPVAAPDGRGGAIVAWAAVRDSGFDVFAQHLLASGRLDPGWPSIGQPLCRAPGDQAAPSIVSDGRGGAIAVWFDQRGGKDHDLYAQRISAAGRAEWAEDGVAVCTAPGHQQAPFAVSDGAGGALVAWWDYRAGADAHIYAQHVRASGVVDSLWPPDGLAVCTAPGAQYFPKAISDGAGGAFITWYDHRGGDYDVYAHHVLAGGAVDPRWPTNGRALCTAKGDQRNPAIASDGHGGAFVVWEDGRQGRRHDVYAHHLLPSGASDRTWPDDGLAVCALESSTQRYPSLAADDLGGFVVAWEDDRDGVPHVYAQRVLPSATIDPRWPANGIRASRSEDSESDPLLEGDGAGSVILEWQTRAADTAEPDLRWARIDPRRPSSTSASRATLCAAPGGQIHVSLARVAKRRVLALWEDGRAGRQTDLRGAWLPPTTSGTRRTSSRRSAR